MATCQTGTLETCQTTQTTLYHHIREEDFGAIHSTSDSIITHVDLCPALTSFGYSSRLVETGVEFLSQCSYHIPAEAKNRCGMVKWRMDDEDPIQAFVPTDTRIVYHSGFDRGYRVYMMDGVHEDGFANWFWENNPEACRSDVPKEATGSNSSYVLAAQATAAACADLGKTPAVANMNSCRDSDVTRCVYPRDALVGGCETKECVMDNILKFRKAMQNLSGVEEWDGCGLPYKKILPAGTTRMTNFTARNSGFAMLIDGMTIKGACGDEGVSCLGKLQSDCGVIFSMATEAQCNGDENLYRVLQRAGQTCIADSRILTATAPT